MARALFDYPNVVGVGEGYKRIGTSVTPDKAKIVLVSQKVPAAALAVEDLIPKVLDGEPTDIMHVGHIMAQQLRTGKWRPAQPGVSLGHYQITAGTFGAVVTDGSGVKLILSNNHVLANSNDAQIGDAILQPGPIDGGREAIATLHDFQPIDFGGGPTDCPTANLYAGLGNFFARLLGRDSRVVAVAGAQAADNLMDAAIALPLDDALIDPEVVGIGNVAGFKEAEFGMTVMKSGRTTEVTNGTVTVLHATVQVGYGAGRTATFVDQIITSDMSEPGDSGSLLVAADDLSAVGLLFAGSDQVTIHSPILPVLNRFGVSI